MDFEASELPYDLLAYERWLGALATTAGAESYLYLEPRVRFAPEPDDALELDPRVRLTQVGQNAVLEHTPTGTRLPVDSVPFAVAQQILQAMDGHRSLIATQLISGATAAQMDAFLRTAFGRVVFCPETLDRFECRIPGYSLVRFPGSPYEISRAYWSNMADVRERYGAWATHHLRPAEFAEALRELHLLALVGASKRSFYRPSSPIVAKTGARPGAYYDVPTRTIRELDRTLFVDGPRVSVPETGGATYHHLLGRSLDDAVESQLERTVTVENVPFGRVTFGQARTDLGPSHWYIPPRPLLPEHLTRLSESHERAYATTSDASARYLDAIAQFHYRWVRVHPFTCANQSLAMNLVNAMLKSRGHAEVPHLLLDHLALRLTESAYVRLFRRFIHHWSLDDVPVAMRHAHLMKQRSKLDSFVARLVPNMPHAQAESLCEAEPDAAGIALLRDPRGDLCEPPDPS